MEPEFFIPIIMFIVMACIMIGCFCYQKKRYENAQYVICRVDPNQATGSNIPVIPGATDMYVIGLHRPGQQNLQMFNVNNLHNPAVTGFMANLRNGLPGSTPFVPPPQSQLNATTPPPSYSTATVPPNDDGSKRGFVS